MLLSRSDSRRLYCSLVTTTILVVVLVGTFHLLPVVGEEEIWWNTDFAYRMKITFDNSKVGENLNDFPMPVVFSSVQSAFWSHVQTYGNDTRFVDSDNTAELYFEFEQFDYASNSMVAWVKVPQVDAWSVTDYIWIYYGNNSVDFDAYYDSSHVWDNNYVGVWHLKETQASDIIRDSTANHNDGAVQNIVGNANYNSSGKLSGCWEFHGTSRGQNHYIKVSDSPSLGLNESITMEAWASMHTTTLNYKCIMAKGLYADVGKFEYFLYTHDRKTDVVEVIGNDGWDWLDGTTTYNTETFYYAVGIFNRNGKQTYTNGAYETSDTRFIGYAPSTTELRIGGDEYPNDGVDGQTFNGLIDEVRISNVSRSSSWIKACYLYQVDQTKFTYGSEERWIPATLYIDPPLIEKGPSDIGTTFQLNVTIESVRDLWSFDFNLTWDSTLLTLVNVDYNTTLDNIWGSSKWFLANETYGVNYYQLAAESTSDSFNSTGSTSIATLEFRVEISNVASQTSIHFVVHSLTDTLSRLIIHTTEDGIYRIAGKKPTLEMSPTFKMCRKFSETFTIKINVSDAGNVKDFSFEIFYNTTLLDYANIEWNAWSSGSVTVDDVNGNITGSTLGSSLSGNLTLVTIEFSAKFYHIWKYLPGWTNNLTGAIYLQWANLSYPSGPDLRYERDGLDEIIVGSDVTYVFAPIQGDVDNDGDVDIFDLRTVCTFYDTINPDYNLTGDSIVDIYDLVVICSSFGYTYR